LREKQIFRLAKSMFRRQIQILSRQIGILCCEKGVFAAVDRRSAILSPARLASQLNPTDSRPVVEKADVLPDGPEDK
jgi:hypothetical protein